ncbi:MAG: hypothetical protein DRI88_00070 [Bacteroidetes bacterium]|nr:MAG: hypothetical protein DRI88_00070 [Bacteroidota bacterium]
MWPTFLFSIKSYVLRYLIVRANIIIINDRKMIPKKSKRNKFLRPFLFNITAYFSKKIYD